ncbi:MAG: DUF5716 family protein [Clostridiales bacterium]|jgi:molecular chaperone DnaK (HSP70)|nr:DUF5716 family protein [Clostridiales bacterium]
MNWKKYREFFAGNKISEDHFVLGIDMGAATSAISYFDPVRRVAEVLDISGGYGKASAPTALQYIADTGEWIFGEYAILNVDGGDYHVLLTDFAAKLGSGEYADIVDSARSLVDIAAIYLTELIANCRNINPKAQVVGIVATVPDFAGAAAKAAMLAAYRTAGFDRVLIDLLPEREAIFAHYFHDKGAMEDERLLLLDFGARGLRGGIYDVAGGKRHVKCLCATMDENLSTAAVDAAIYNLLAGYYCKNRKMPMDKLSKTEHQQLYTFTHQHKDMILGHGDGKSPLKLYYNFAYPPFSVTVPRGDVDRILRAHGQKMEDFVRDLASKASCQLEDIDAIICTGGGFEMPWAKKRVAPTLFPKEKLQTHFKNAKTVLAQGATYAAAGRLGLLPQIRFNIEDVHKIPWDVGIQVGGANGGKYRFLPILERDFPLWQKPRTAYVILQGGAPEIGIYKRDAQGIAAKVGVARLSGFPPRPPGTTKVSVDIAAKTAGHCVVTIKDLGFGEIFPSSGISEEIEVRI